MDLHEDSREIIKRAILEDLQRDDLEVNDRWMELPISENWPTPSDLSRLWLLIVRYIEGAYEVPQNSELRLIRVDTLKGQSVRNLIDILEKELARLEKKSPGPDTTTTIKENVGWFNRTLGFGFISREADDEFVHIFKRDAGSAPAQVPGAGEQDSATEKLEAPPQRKPRDPSRHMLCRVRYPNRVPEEESVDGPEAPESPSASFTDPAEVSHLDSLPPTVESTEIRTRDLSEGQGVRREQSTPVDQPPELEDPFVELLGSTEHVVASECEPPAEQAAEVQPEATIVSVFYATDRLQLPKVTSDTQYGAGRSPMGAVQLGKCEVSIPKKHKLGKLETPSILRFEFRPDYSKHIVLKKTFTLDQHKFFEQVKASVSKSVTKDAFVFIHGYNVSFEDAARRTGQIAYDLNFIGAPIFYSWPSNDKMADYAKDETNVAWSAPHLQEFLALLSQNSGAERIHIIAHSMGNRAVCEALKALSYDTTSRLKFNHLVLAAPDIDADTFRELASTLQRLSARITLYESSKDKALFASKTLHGNPRAGEPLLIIPGLDTIDASAIDTNFLGHSYFSDNYPLLSDIHSILLRDEPPSSRFGLHEIQHVDGKYYAFKA